MELVFDENFDLNIKDRFGKNVTLITNIMKDNPNFDEIMDICKTIDSIFIDKAYIGDGTIPYSKMVGIYTVNVDGIKEFWNKVQYYRR